MLGEQQLVAYRSSPGTTVDGLWVPGTRTTVRFRGVIQPLDDRTMLQLQEGFRARARFKLYSLTELHTVDVFGSTDADNVVWQGRELEVAGVRDYMNTPSGMTLNHFKYVLLAPERTND